MNQAPLTGVPDFRWRIPRGWRPAGAHTVEKAVANKIGSTVKNTAGNSLEQTAASGRWSTPEGHTLSLQFVPGLISISPSMLEDYRMDARLAARALGGGLVECDIVPGRGVFSISKLPDTFRDSGLFYTGLGLLPLNQGHMAVTILAREGEQTGLRENRVFRKLNGERPFDASGLDARWFADPYDETYEHTARAKGWSGRTTLRCPADDEVHDASFPDHALTAVRRILHDLRKKARGDHAAVKKQAGALRIAEPEYALFLEVPEGYHAVDYGELRRGRIFRRRTFENRMDIIGICPQPDFPEAGRSERGARRLLKQNERGNTGKPIIRSVTLEGRTGILCEIPGRDGERELLTLAMYLPWGDSSLEISVGWEADDRERMQERLRRVLRSLRRIVD